MKYDNLSKLMEQTHECFQKYDWFEMDAEGRILKKQRGVFRVNCMDNLDRTNVVMSLIARRVMLLFLHVKANDINRSWLDSPFPSFENYFKNAWADNADAVSVMYAGTGALKTDFTRTGKRTFAGALHDGINSLIRYDTNHEYVKKCWTAIFFSFRYNKTNPQIVASRYIHRYSRLDLSCLVLLVDTT